MQTLIDYLTQKTDHNKTILVINDLAKGQSMIRNVENTYRKSISNVTCMTLNQIAYEMYLNIVASQLPNEKPYKLMNFMESFIFFHSVLQNNLQNLNYFKNKKLLDMATTKELYLKICLIRSNPDWDWSKINFNDKIQDIQFLINEYKKQLSTKHVMDSVALYSYVTAWISNNDSSDILHFFSQNKMFYIAEDAYNYHGLQKTFLEQLNISEIAVYDSTQSVNSDAFSSCKGKTFFYKGYGSFNEIGYIVNDIYKNKIPFGQVTLLYTSESQLPSIEAMLKGNRINASFLSEYPANDNDYINLIQRILSWAENDFSEKNLEKILSSNALALMFTDEKNNSENLLFANSYFRYVLDARNQKEDPFELGWTYERNRTFIKNRRNYYQSISQSIDQTSLAKKHKFLELHEELLNIFSKNDSIPEKVLPNVICNNLLNFIKTYSLPSLERNSFLDQFKKVINFLPLEETNKISLTNTINFINELLSQISFSDTEDSSSVKIQCLNDWIYLDRSYIYITGLNLKNMQGSTIESPILSDEEMELCLPKGNPPTIQFKEKQKQQNLENTLRSFSGEQIHFGYSDYDTVNFCENNPSSFFRKALSKLSNQEITQLQEFIYGNPDDEQTFPNIPNNNIQIKSITAASHSSSKLETLLFCPKKYAFQHVLFVPDNSFIEYTNKQWLDSLHLGSFFHLVAQRYVDKKLILPSSQAYDNATDKNCLHTIVEKAKEDFLQFTPVAFIDLANTEAQNIEELCTTYFDLLHKNLQPNASDFGWRPIFTEQPFSKLIWTVTIDNSTQYDFTLSGIIDRIDYKLDPNTSTIHLRIIDYKTGKKSNKETQLTEGAVLQHILYFEAIQNGFLENKPLSDVIRKKISTFENNVDILHWKMQCTEFQYQFPRDTSAESPYIILKNDEDNDQNNNSIKRLEIILTNLSKNNIYLNHDQLKEELCKINISIKQKNPCEYCNYYNLCH